MSTHQPQAGRLSLLGSALLLSCALAGLWLAAAVVLPSAAQVMQQYGTQIPALFSFGLIIRSQSYHFVYPIAFAGLVMLGVALLRRGSPRFVSICGAALPRLAGVVACFAIYLLGSGGVAWKLASLDQYRETRFYRQTLEQFALLEAAQGRYEKLREDFQEFRNMKMVEVRSPADFNDVEANDRISSLIAALPKSTDPATKRRILATLSLFRQRIHKNSYPARDVPRHAIEAGAPPMNSHVEAFDWIASSLNKDGWDPLPLFKLSPQGL